MSLPNLMSINPIAVKTFYQKAKMGGARGKVKVEVKSRSSMLGFLCGTMNI